MKKLLRKLMQRRKSGPAISAASDRGARGVWVLSRMLTPVTWVAALGYLFSGQIPNMALAMSVAVVFSLPPLLIHFGRPHAAKRMFLFQFLFLVFIVPLAVGPPAMTEWVAILLPAIGYFLFEEERHSLYLLLGLASYGLIKCIYHFHTPWMPPALLDFYHFMLASAVCLFVYWLLVIFKRDTVQSEAIIREQHKVLLENQEAMARQNADLRHFAHAVSHDLKEPLRNIGSFSNLLARRIGDDPSQRELLHFIEDGAKRMSRLLDDLIGYAQVGMHNSPAEPVELNDLLKVVRLNLRLRLEQLGGRIEAMSLPALLAHRTLFMQLFQNIVGNGLKYSRPDVPPVVQIRCLRKDGNLLFVFRDNGIGIAPEHLERIFEPFRRLHNRSEFEGSGIGLATCRKIVEQYGGRIWAESTPGEGTAFFVELPAGMLMEAPEQRHGERWTALNAEAETFL
ncbi:MAG: ATP-binding protein [Saprospiraceae bacterium]